MLALAVSLLREIQASAVGTDTSVAVLLRQCLVLAHRLQHEPLRDWAKLELGGYPADVLLPPYRQKYRTHVIGHLSGGFGSEMRDVGLPPAGVPDAELREMLFTADTRQGVAAIEQLLSVGDDTFQSPWPMDAVAVLQSRFWDGYNLVEAHKVIPATALAATLSGIRDRVVLFALEIEAEDPQAGEAAPGEPRIAEQRVTQIFTNTIYGGNNVITGAGRDATVVVHNSRIDAAWPELARSLSELGVPQSELEELGVALRTDGDPSDELGPATQSWADRLRAKVTSGGIVLAQSATVEMVVHEILRVLGQS